MDPSSVVKIIEEHIKQEINQLPSHIQEWVRSHLIQPRQVLLATDPEGKSYVQFWLVTDHTNTADANYRVVFDPSSREFGLECRSVYEIEWFMGLYGSFAETGEVHIMV